MWIGSRFIGKYTDVSNLFIAELEKALTSESGKDYPHKGEESTKQCLTNYNKLKSIRLKYFAPKYVTVFKSNRFRRLHDQ